MSADYGYINARVRGLKAKLLGSEFFGAALDASDFSAFTTALAQSPYMRDLEEAQSRYSGLKAVDEALARNFYRTTRSILGFADGTPQKLIELMLFRYDLANLKAIARAKHAGRDAKDIESALFPAGRLKPAVLDSIAAAPDMPSVAQALGASGHPLSGAFRRAAAQYSSSGDLYGLELALDQAYFRTIFAQLKKLNAPRDFVRHIHKEVDATNLRTALKLRGKTEQSDELFVSGGKEVSRDMFMSILSDSSQAALQTLSNTSFKEVAETSGLSEAEEVVRGVVDSSARRIAVGHPLDIGVVLNYLRQKEAEAARLRLLARGKFYQVPRGALEKELGHA